MNSLCVNKSQNRFDSRRSNSLAVLAAAKLLCVLTVCLSFATAAIGQQVDAPEPQKGIILGTAIDANGGAIPGATVVLAAVETEGQRIVAANNVGFFELGELEAGTPYQ